MKRQGYKGIDTLCQSENRRSVEITGQIRGMQMHPPGDGDGGGTFQIMLEDGVVVVSPYLVEWHKHIASALQANDIALVKVKGIGEFSADGELQCIVEPESITRCWTPAPNRLFDAETPQWETLLATRGEIR